MIYYVKIKNSRLGFSYFLSYFISFYFLFDLISYFSIDRT